MHFDSNFVEAKDKENLSLEDHGAGLGRERPLVI